MYSNNTFLLVCVWEEISVESTGEGGAGLPSFKRIGLLFNIIFLFKFKRGRGQGGA